MKFLRVAACAVLASPLVLFAEPGGPRPIPRPGGGGPSHSTTGRAGEGGGSRDGDHGPRGERNREDMELFREKLQEFCKTHSPNRWTALEENAHGDKNPLKFGGMFFRFRGLVMLENQDKGLYDIKVRQIEIEDKEYGLMKDVREARKAEDTAKVERLTGELRELSAKYVASRIDEHAHRITRLERAIEAEKGALASDQKNKEGLIKEHLESLLNDAPKSRSRDGEGASTAPVGAAPVIEPR